MLGVSLHSVEVLEFAHEAGLRGGGERTKRSRIQVPDDINCGLIAGLTSVSVGYGPVPGVALEAGSQQKWHTTIAARS